MARWSLKRRDAAARLVAGAGCAALLVAGAPPASGQTWAVDVGPGETLSVSEHGRGAVVLVLPSLTAPAFGFRRLVPLLVAAGCRVLVMDPLGLGGSSQPKTADYSLGAQADRVGRALDTLQTGSAVVVAQAGGTSLALRLAYRRPALVRAVVSIEGGIAEEAMTPGARRAIRFAPLLKLFGGKRLLRGRVGRTLAERSVDRRWVTREVEEAYLRYAGADFDAILRTYRLMAAAREAERLRGQLSRIRCPVRLLLGASPPAKGVPEEELAAMRTGLARLEIERVTTSGHFIAEEAPEAVARAVEAVLAETAAEAGALSEGPAPSRP